MRPDVNTLPLFIQCPVCKPSNDKCVDCQTNKAEYRSQTATHGHVKLLDGKAATEVIFRDLCLTCYRADWLKVYPDEPYPV